MAIFRPMFSPIYGPILGPVDGDMPWDGPGGGGFRGLNLLSGGTFTRSTEASYLTGAPTDGSTAFLAWAAVNERRIEDRGDGLGPMLLMEGSRTNLVKQSRGATAIPPWAAGTTPATADQGQGPDATTLADRGAPASGQYSNYQSIAASAALYAMSVWTKRYPGAGAGTAQVSLAGTSPLSKQWAITDAAWARGDLVTTPGAGATFVPWEGRGIYSGGAAQATNYLADLHQLELGAFPSSPIRTTTAAVTRGADVLTYAVGQYPASFLDRGFRIAFACDASSAELIAAGVTAQQLMVAMTGYNSFIDYLPGASLTLRAASSGVVKASVAVTFSRYQLVTIEVRPSAGTLLVSGATTGNGLVSGTPWSWAAATLNVGRSGAGTEPCFGRFSTTIVGL